MPFTGKPTYGAGTDLPELVEDVSDVIGIVSPWETPLLDYLGDAKKPALSTVHEWIEDTLLPNTDSLNQTTFTPDPPQFPSRNRRLRALGKRPDRGPGREPGRNSAGSAATPGQPKV